MTGSSIYILQHVFETLATGHRIILLYLKTDLALYKATITEALY